ncbi:hypothetical protein LZ554_005054 [Drepanopeziza brunnea f. sp. 'monogermtubi']|nr:hypothetical protein LZ554_005054 [Drepanopeziza brunnea f. sp. 'monogermtubi']
MKTVPSLVASSTVGIAAVGLALGKPERSSPTRPSSKKRKVGDVSGALLHNNSGPASLNSRPATSNAVRDRGATPIIESPSNPSQSLRSRPPSTRTRAELQHHNRGRKLSIFRHEETSIHSEEDTRRESISSRGSWIRKISMVPNSHNNSPRSSIGPDSSSLALPSDSAGPILSNPADIPAQLPPNKLVKKNTSGRATSGPVSKSGSQIPTLRRPATSHQRSVTLHQQFRNDFLSMQESLQPNPSPRVHVIPPSSKNNTPDSRRTWRLYFESRPTKISKERASGRSSDAGLPNHPLTSRRVIPDESARPTLVKPGTVIPLTKNAMVYYDESFELDDDELDDVEETPLPSVEVTEEPHKRARRSLSMHFSSPSSWIPRSGSLRGKKRGAAGRSGGKRYSSAPLPTLPGRNISTAHGITASGHRPILDQSVFQRESLSLSEESSSNDPFAGNLPRRSRNSSSPLPPLSRLSSFNVDLARLGLSSSSSSSAPCRSPNSPVLQTQATLTSVPFTSHASPASTPFVSSSNSKPLRFSELTDRTSTLVGSDNDMKGFISGDDDDMDFQSETVFDSLRSGATGSICSHKAPLDSIFDESPPSVNGNVKSKRLSIHEMLANGGFQEGHSRIVEEDEGTSTPVKGGRSSQEDVLETPVRKEAVDSEAINFPSSPPSFCLATKDFGRMSLDDEDEDEDWTRDDENLDVSNQLSPPSSSLNSRKVNPSFRAALADVSHTGITHGNNELLVERPRSTLFDWSEQPSTDKVDLKGNSPRPKTAHGKQMADGRGGRVVGRRGSSALHIRSQSVPVVPDVAGQREHSKLIPKFGTWGLGGKGVSEDWDGDFEFDESNEDDDAQDGDIKMENSGMLVPPAIQASQASVVGHVGQIREVCLLVEDLKRLRLLAKEKDLLNGPSSTLWKEAEGIIALAVPDEEDQDLPPPDSPVSDAFDQEVSEDDDYHESGPDAEDLSTSGTPFDVLNRHGRPTGFIYDGNTVRRRSVFSPDDDIFGAGLVDSPVRDHLRPPSTSPRHSSMKSSSDVARSVMEIMHQHRSTSDPVIQSLASHSPNKMPFDTTSLRDLVHRANVLSRTLADLIRKADGNAPTPEVTPHRDSSPAFTRVFTDPSVSPPKHLLRSQSNNSIIVSGSLDSSPTRSLGNRMHMLTVV